MIDFLRPYVIVEKAPDGPTLHGYGARVRRFWSRAGATRYAAALTARDGWVRQVRTFAGGGNAMARWASRSHGMAATAAYRILMDGAS